MLVLGTQQRHEDPPSGYAARRPGRVATGRGDTEASCALRISDVREVSRSSAGSGISVILTIDEVPSTRAALCRWFTETIESPNRGVASVMNPHEHRYQLMIAFLLFVPFRSLWNPRRTADIPMSDRVNTIVTRAAGVTIAAKPRLYDRGEQFQRRESTMDSMDVEEATIVMRPRDEDERSAAAAAWGRRLTSIGTAILRYGLVFLLVLIGSMKFFAFEARGIQPLVAHSPFLSWMYQVLSVQGVSNFFGCVEIATGILIALRRFSPKASAAGSLAGTFIFLTTVSFLFTTPGALAPGSDVGGFLMKDLVLLGAAIYTGGEALLASNS